MPSTTKLYLSGLAKFLDGRMKSHGFKRRNFLYSKKTDFFWFMVHWQISRDQLPNAAKFTINVGVHDRNLVRKLGDDSDACPDIWDCHFRQRVGFLLPEKDDKWWSFPLGVPFSVADGNEFVKLLENVIFPFFDGFDSPESLLDIWMSGRSPGQTDFQRLQFIEVMQGKI